MALGSTPAYDATYALSHALRTIAEGGSATKAIDVTHALSQIHGGAVAVPVASGPARAQPSAVPIRYRLEPKGKRE